MNKLFYILFAISLFLFTSCGDDKDKTEESVTLNINGTFVGKDNSNRDATVIVNGADNKIDINLTDGENEFVISGTVILTSIASSGKKLAEGDITYNVDLKIDNATLPGFTNNEVSLGRIIKATDTNNVLTYTCTFNFTDSTERGTDTNNSDWYMNGTKVPTP